MLDKFLNNIIYIILSFVFVGSIASDFTLEDRSLKLKAYESRDLQLCDKIILPWIQQECISSIDKNHRDSSNKPLLTKILFVTMVFVLLALFICSLKLLRIFGPAFLSKALSYFDKNLGDKLYDFSGVEKQDFKSNLKSLLQTTMFLLLGTMMICSFFYYSLRW